MHYLDNAATTQILPEVIDTVYKTLPCFANPSSLYKMGMEAQELLEQNRQLLAQTLGCQATEVVFTGSGTEGNMLALFGAARARQNWGRHIVATGYEHPCVHSNLQLLAQKEGFTLTLVPPSANGQVQLNELLEAVTSKTVLVAAMHVNNETGAVLDVSRLASAVKSINGRTAVHVDGVQGFTKIPLKLKETQIDSYAISGHKIHAPKGVGAVYLRKGFNLLPAYVGGGQEFGMRPGTENLPYIAALAKAATMAHSRHSAHAQAVALLNAHLCEGLRSIKGLFHNSPNDGYSGIVNFSLPDGIRGETMLHFLEERNVFVSVGSACAKGLPSHTLSAMGLSSNRILSALRVSFDGYNTARDIDALLNGISDGLLYGLKGLA